jgi:hypothetical protein
MVPQVNYAVPEPVEGKKKSTSLFVPPFRKAKRATKEKRRAPLNTLRQAQGPTKMIFILLPFDWLRTDKLVPRVNYSVPEPVEGKKNARVSLRRLFAKRKGRQRKKGGST